MTTHACRSLIHRLSLLRPTRPAARFNTKLPYSTRSNDSATKPQQHANQAPSPATHHHDEQTRPRRIVVGITGATGTVYATRILSILQQLGVETHLVISKWALATMKYETPLSEADIRALASRSYVAKDLSAPIASGSFQHDGMIIVPCSMKTLAAVRTGFCDDLISRAADVTLKEGRKLLLAVRETPLSDVHLDNMLFLRRAGAVIFPPVPAFYTRPRSMDDLVDQTAGRMLDSMGLFTDGFKRWDGFERD
ncbi:phenylacrylic acid decarboxylase [Metarhizium guizhouense ARSEF 977]|uniref:Flavin prenyltransferase PAD1, mitochondrial n=1 Tax=Metarhizium guizhouense (strain ARSEF 977) TaxID=1276136 RepID=A0A0B4GVC3_METGA|nr:phenylacrylic acid decarboxylase [Metarhizium guizhouense ARSEF 977]